MLELRFLLLDRPLLCKCLSENTIVPMSEIHTKMALETAQPTGNAVIQIPCVLLPRFSRICGVCACVNQLLLVTCTKQELLAHGCIEKQLKKYGLTNRTAWTKQEWTCAGAVLIEDFVNGSASHETVNSLLQRMSAVIQKNEQYFVEQLECNENTGVNPPEDQAKESRSGKFKQTSIMDFAKK